MTGEVHIAESTRPQVFASYAAHVFVVRPIVTNDATSCAEVVGILSAIYQTRLPDAPRYPLPSSNRRFSSWQTRKIHLASGPFPIITS